MASGCLQWCPVFTIPIGNSFCFAKAGSLTRSRCEENIYFLHIRRSQTHSNRKKALYTNSKWIKWKNGKKHVQICLELMYDPVRNRAVFMPSSAESWSHLTSSVFTCVSWRVWRILGSTCPPPFQNLSPSLDLMWSNWLEQKSVCIPHRISGETLWPLVCML